jgi:tetratricopeptide (TPR) repeat protein
LYIRTPKKYRAGHRPRRNLFNLRWLWLWVLTPLIAFGGWQLYERRAELAPPIERALDGAIAGITGGIATAVAPTVTPRPDPSQALAAADGAWQSGAVEEALNAYRQVLPDVPNDVTRHYFVAMGLIMDGRYADAVEAAEQAINADPFSADAWAIHAYALAENDQQTEAIASGLQALSLEPDNARALAYLANAYYLNNQIELASQTVERALAADPESPDAYFVNGQLNYFSRFDFDAALNDYETTLQYMPNYLRARINIAYIQMSNSDYEAARDTLLTVTELNPNNLDALFALSFLYLSGLGDANQALEPIQRCVTIDPQNRACLFYLGNVQRQLGNNTEALRVYRQLIDTGTQNPSHFLALARSYIDGAGDCDSAISVLQEGYRLEENATVPNFDRLAAFEELLQTCGVSVAPTAEATAEATPAS